MPNTHNINISELLHLFIEYFKKVFSLHVIHNDVLQKSFPLIIDNNEAIILT